MFLLARFFISTLFAVSLFGQSGLRSEHFAVLSESKDEARSRRVLERLEEMRAALMELNGAGWEPKVPVAVWIPGSIEAYRQLATRADQAGLFQSGRRQSWIVVSPKAEFFLEVLSHEYVHAVLARALPGLPGWLEEGLCEYYSTLRYTAKGIEVGRAPSRRLDEIARGEMPSAEVLEARQLANGAYGYAWGLVATLSGEDGFPGRLERPKELKIPKPRLFAGRRPVMEATRSADVAELKASLAVGYPLEIGPADGAEESFLEGSRLLDQGRAANAVALLEKATGLRPSNSTWWHTLAFAYGELGEDEKKRAAAERALAAAVNETERQQALALLR